MQERSGGRRTWWLMVVVASAIGVGVFVFTPPSALEYEGVEGPLVATPLLGAQPSSWQVYSGGGPSRLAVLLTDTASSWLGLAHGLKSIGIPFRFTRDPAEALRHNVVLVYPTISGAVLDQSGLQALARFPRDGGTLIGINVEGGGLSEVFGFSEAVPSRARSQITFDVTHPIGSGFTDERERTIPFSNPVLGDLAAGSLGYLNASAPLATFDDGSAAITARRIGEGAAYAFGIDPGFLLLRAYSNREQDVSRAYVNGFEPSLDVLLRTLLAIYEDGEPGAVTVNTVPDGHAIATLITHDIDYGGSLATAVEYAQMEDSLGVPATYFVQAKYVRDWNDRAFLDEAGQVAVRALDALGMEVASHSVAHSLQFSGAAVGTGEEQYPSYEPRVRDAERTDGLSVLGELRVSRFLLETFAPGLEIVSFRPGHLRNPYTLPEAMEATGYRYSSSVTAGNSLTHLPFQLTRSRGPEAEIGIYEFPVTIEDEAEPPLPDRLGESVRIADQVAAYGGLFVVLIHTDEAGRKLDYERKLIGALRDRDAWFGTLRDFGAFWVARDGVEVDVESDVASGGIVINLDAAEEVVGLTLRLPPGVTVKNSEPAGIVRGSGAGWLVLEGFVGRVRLSVG